MRSGRWTSRRARAPGLALLALGTVACAAAMDQIAPAPAVAVSLGQPSVVVSVAAADTLFGQPTLHFTVDASIHNAGPGSVYLALPCDPPVEQLTATGWVPAVGGTVCEAVARPPIEIAAGETLRQPVRVAATPGPNTSKVGGIPRWLPGTSDGSYRLEFTLFVGQTLLAESSRVSPTFTLTP